MPFGGGSRVCIGRDKARVETVYGLVRFAQVFQRLQAGGGDTRVGKGAQHCNVMAARRRIKECFEEEECSRILGSKPGDEAALQKSIDGV